MWDVDCFGFLNDTATTESYTYGHTLSLHDALPILTARRRRQNQFEDRHRFARAWQRDADRETANDRSEEHTSELQSLMRISYVVFCLKKITPSINICQWYGSV